MPAGRGIPRPLSVLRKLLQLLFALFAGIHLAGGPYALVQAYAWAGMLVSYSMDDGLLKGAQDTFSGEKPCALCCEIAEAKKNESGGGRQDTPVSPSLKLLKEMVPLAEIALSPPRFTVPPAAVFPRLTGPVDVGPDAPPVPPPRIVA